VRLPSCHELPRVVAGVDGKEGVDCAMPDLRCNGGQTGAWQPKDLQIYVLETVSKTFIR
jgi:hypothetical protein